MSAKCAVGVYRDSWVDISHFALHNTYRTFILAALQQRA